MHEQRCGKFAAQSKGVLERMTRVWRIWQLRTVQARASTCWGKAFRYSRRMLHHRACGICTTSHCTDMFEAEICLCLERTGKKTPSTNEIYDANKSDNRKVIHEPPVVLCVQHKDTAIRQLPSFGGKTFGYTHSPTQPPSH